MQEQTIEKVEPKVIRILVVDDHPMVRQGISEFLGIYDDLDVIGTAANGREAIQKVEELDPDVILLDLMMPEMDGLQALNCIKQLKTAGRVIVLTSYDQDDKVFPAIKAGADGYLLKDVLPADLVNAIRQVHEGKSVLHPDIAQKLMQRVSLMKQDEKNEQLTARESEVLELIAAGLSNNDIAEKLTISQKTVKTHVSNIFQKINVSHRVQAALYAMNNGKA